MGETEFVNGAAAQSASGAYGPTVLCAGIVGGVELEIGARIEAVLEAHLQAGGGRFRGVRPTVGWHEDTEILAGNTAPHMLLQDEAKKALRCISAKGLSLDLFLFYTQTDDLVQTARAYPDMTVISNHTGGLLGMGPYAGRRDEVFEDWRAAMKRAAACPNVMMKLGGLGMRYAGFNFHEHAAAPSSDILVKAWAPYFETCIELFGPDRCMFESNFPVDKGAYSYHVLWNAFKKLATPYSPDEQDRLLRDTAIEVYKLQLESVG